MHLLNSTCKYCNKIVILFFVYDTIIANCNVNTEENALLGNDTNIYIKMLVVILT